MKKDYNLFKFPSDVSWKSAWVYTEKFQNYLKYAKFDREKSVIFDLRLVKNVPPAIMGFLITSQKELLKQNYSTKFLFSDKTKRFLSENRILEFFQ